MQMNIDKLDAQATEYLQYIRSSSQLMGQLIDDLLNLSRLSRTEMSLQVLAYNMKRMINMFGVKPLIAAIAA